MLPPSLRGSDEGWPTWDPDPPVKVLDAAVKDAETCGKDPTGGDVDRDNDARERAAVDDCSSAGLIESYRALRITIKRRMRRF